MARNGRANHAGRWTSRRSLSVPRMVLEFPNSRNQDRWWSARGHGTIHRFGRQGGRRESLPRGLVVVRSLAGRAARAICLALGCNGSTRLHNDACKSAGPPTGLRFCPRVGRHGSLRAENGLNGKGGFKEGASLRLADFRELSRAPAGSVLTWIDQEKRGTALRVALHDRG